jgi:hypothetical protein
MSSQERALGEPRHRETPRSSSARLPRLMHALHKNDWFLADVALHAMPGSFSPIG